MISGINALSDTARAFDAVASEYDGPLGNNILIQHMRERVVAKIVATFPRGAKLLDVGCGTGLDAVDLAERGYEIVAIDLSSGMVEWTRARAVSARLESQVTAIRCGIQEIYRLSEGPFDGLYSNLGPLNCVTELNNVPREMARLLKPGGRIIAAVIGKYCPWEIGYYALHGDLGRARIRFTNQVVPVPLKSGTVWTRYYSPHEFYRAFEDTFEIISLRALNVFLPPPYFARAYARHPYVFAPLAFLDRHLGGAPVVRNLGDHFLIELRKRN